MERLGSTETCSQRTGTCSQRRLPSGVVFSLSESQWRCKRIRLGKTSRICLLDANSLGEAGFPVDGADSVVGGIGTSRTFFHCLASSLVDWAIGFEMCLTWKER